MLMRLFAFFESFVEPFPKGPVSRPPNKLLPFLWHYSRDVWPWLLILASLTALISILEVSLFNYLGNGSKMKYIHLIIRKPTITEIEPLTEITQK